MLSRGFGWFWGFACVGCWALGSGAVEFKGFAISGLCSGLRVWDLSFLRQATTRIVALLYIKTTGPWIQRMQPLGPWTMQFSEMGGLQIQVYLA